MSRRTIARSAAWASMVEPSTGRAEFSVEGPDGLIDRTPPGRTLVRDDAQRAGRGNGQSGPILPFMASCAGGSPPNCAQFPISVWVMSGLIACVATVTTPSTELRKRFCRVREGNREAQGRGPGSESILGMVRRPDRGSDCKLKLVKRRCMGAERSISYKHALSGMHYFCFHQICVRAKSRRKSTLSATEPTVCHCGLTVPSVSSQRLRLARAPLRAESLAAAGWRRRYSQQDLTSR